MSLEAQIDNIIESKKISSPQDKIKLLRRHAAFWYLALQYESIYHIIFGTQISLLQHLNSKPFGVTMEEADTYYKKSISLGLRDYPFKDYIGYLLGSSLIEQKDEKYFITMQGKGFLYFLIEDNKNMNKGL
jgi:hypothetical protein